MSDKGQLICACNMSGLVGCTSCDFAKKHNPDKVHFAKWATKIFPAHAPADPGQLEILADMIIRDLDEKDLEGLGIKPIDGGE